MHYHGTPITPHERMLALVGRNFCVSYAAPRQVAAAHEIGQSVMLDNGAFSFWKTGQQTDWEGYYEWAALWLEFPTSWAVIPDVIDGTAAANDALLEAWPFPGKGAPVWHMHEPVERLGDLCSGYERVCLGSSGEFATIGDTRWHHRMREAMNVACDDDGVPRCWLHMLRGLSLCGGPYPFASADSTNIARNHAGIQTRRTPAQDVRLMAERIDGVQCPARFRRAEHSQLSLMAAS